MKTYNNFLEDLDVLAQKRSDAAARTKERIDKERERKQMRRDRDKEAAEREREREDDVRSAADEVEKRLKQRGIG